MCCYYAKIILFILIQFIWFFESSLWIALLILDEVILNNSALLFWNKGKVSRVETFLILMSN